MKTKTSEKANSWTRPGIISNEEFIAGIRKAEEGKFISVQESMLNFEKWLKSRKKTVVTSEIFDIDITEVFEYGEETFGYNAAKSFVTDVYNQINELESIYLFYPECRYIVTKGKIYRNIIIGSYLIIYRITNHRIEVLRIISSFRSISKIKTARRIKI